MPHYFFHLAFDLSVTQPPQDSEQGGLNNPSFILPSNFDLFEGSLPSPKPCPWTSSFAPRKQSFKHQSSSHRQRPLSKSPARHSHSSRSLKNHPSPQRHKEHDCRLYPHKPSESPVEDWRHDFVSVESIDMEACERRLVPSLAKSLDDPKALSQSAADGLAIKGKYIPSNPRTSSLGSGVIHLYRDLTPSSAIPYDPALPSEVDEAQNDNHDREQAYLDRDCTTLCILAVPSYMTPSDFLGWIGEEARDDISHFRLIRTSRSNKYMVLMKIRESAKARHWQKSWNGKLFNSMEVSLITSIS